MLKKLYELFLKPVEIDTHVPQGSVKCEYCDYGGMVDVVTCDVCKGKSILPIEEYKLLKEKAFN